jgi:hypothetical protein
MYPLATTIKKVECYYVGLFSAYINCSEQLLSERRAFFPSMPHNTMSNISRFFSLTKDLKHTIKEERRTTNDLSPPRSRILRCH